MLLEIDQVHHEIQNTQHAIPALELAVAKLKYRFDVLDTASGYIPAIGLDPL
jgi:hypothetical protein